ncbi:MULTISPECIES: hypothetical protein [unclassified Xanthomonas]|uniref:hypothetical protein n=1 Tax=unclassified Xanthomonas TaxID=2643310 RepID=UPI0028831801|nr:MULTISPECIES: hypothetical protein [unclassified Xanthomonas]
MAWRDRRRRPSSQTTFIPHEQVAQDGDDGGAALARHRATLAGQVGQCMRVLPSAIRHPPSAMHKHQAQAQAPSTKHQAFEHNQPSNRSMVHLVPSGRIGEGLDSSPARRQARQSLQDVSLWLCAAAITASSPTVRFTRNTAGCSQIPRSPRYPALPLLPIQYHGYVLRDVRNVLMSPLLSAGHTE